MQANNIAQTLPFSQDWSNTGLITADDNWSGVPGIVGFLGDYTTSSPTNVDPQTLLQDMTTVDVIANQTNPNTLVNGGVAEFDGIANHTIALQGSGTADAPSVVFYLNTTGCRISMSLTTCATLTDLPTTPSNRLRFNTASAARATSPTSPQATSTTRLQGRASPRRSRLSA